ncbi:response regulator [Phenylobacterium montanum]|uniref:Response regulator n=1 Tax=Phenylobacterium montanum TaxID=2823693 RepID=A0A975FWR5_9CAUL|nr:response regulator [Caulobacter sp. S6]QUD86710.1 response regulator [Caulobacter sp. S6]
MYHPAVLSAGLDLWLAAPPAEPGGAPGTSGAVGAGKAPPLRVLIVEDEVMIAMTLEALVEDFGHEVCGVASTGEDGVRQALAAQPDVILMDINLGAGIDGIEAARQARASLDARMVFVTAYSDAGTLTRVRQAIPDAAVVNKPFDSDGLRAAIERTTGH